jgi:hypothetical protein
VADAVGCPVAAFEAHALGFLDLGDVAIVDDDLDGSVA